MLLAIICGLVLCQTGWGSKVLVLKESFENASTWDAWTCTNIERGNVSSTCVRRHRGSTGSTATGPNNASDGSWYIYYEDSSCDDTILCTSPIYANPVPGGRCDVSYYTNAYGDTTQPFNITMVSGGNRVGVQYKQEDGNIWRQGGFGSTYLSANRFTIELQINGSSSYRGDTAFDDIEVYCTGPEKGNTTDSPISDQPTNITYQPTKSTYRPTNITRQPTRDQPTNEDPEVRVKFGGLDVNANLPKFEAVEDLGEALSSMVYIVHNIVALPYNLLYYLIHGY